jgi:hypothetical protein
MAQYQQLSKQQPVRQQTQQTQPKQGRKDDRGGFDGLVVDQRCRIKTGTGEVIEGIVSAASKYWYLVNVDGQVVIVNKAHVVSIMPLQNPAVNNQQSTAVGGGNEQGPKSK